MGNLVYDYIVLGGGISGLSSAYYLKQKGLKGLIFEKSDKVGGVLQSRTFGKFQLDFGANSASLTPEFEKLIADLNLTDKLWAAEAISKKRYLVSNGYFHAVEPNPIKILQSKLLSAKAKYQLFTESFRKAQPNNADESVAEFVSRRFGDEILEKVFDPVLSGIYAGNVQHLSMQQVMPALVDWEKVFGSVTKGVFKNAKTMKPRQIVNFDGGFSTLVTALQKILTDEIQLDTNIIAIEKTSDFYTLKVNINSGDIQFIQTRNVISTLPAYALSRHVFNFDEVLGDWLCGIDYTQMRVLHIAFQKTSIPLIPQGFGFLVPSIEKMSFLGAINQSLIFPQKAPPDVALLTVFHKKNNVPTVIADLKKLLRTNAEPVFQESYYWEHALPQFNVGYKKILDRVEAFEKENPHFYLQGNWRTGVAVGNIISKAFALSEKFEK